jgi:hypothetical protein
MLLREDFIHYHMRDGLRRLGWELVAGQYPNGSDDELPVLAVLDPELARDRSPDHRRHSFNKLVPDLVALKDLDLLVVEAKPQYNEEDEAKLLRLRGARRADFDAALGAILHRRGLAVHPAQFSFVPCQAMSAGARLHAREDFAYLFVDQEGVAVLELPGESA